MLVRLSCRLYPTESQSKYFWAALSARNHMYNKAKEWCDAYYQETGKMMPKAELARRVTEYKPSFMETCDFQLEHHTFREGAEAYYDALSRAVRKKKGFPKYHHGRHQRKRSFMVRTDGHRAHNIIKEDSNLVSLPGLTKVDPKRKQVRSNIQHTNWTLGNSGVKSARVVWDGKYWSLSYVVDIDFPLATTFSKPIGIDVGIKHYAVTSEGVKYDTAWSLPRYQKLVKRVKGYQKKLARQRRNENYESNNNYWKTRKRLQVVERNLAEYKKQFVISTTKNILRNNPACVVMENLNIEKMKATDGTANRKLRSNIHNVGWYALRQRVEHEVNKYGGKFIAAPTHYPSTKKCNHCGQLQEMPLSERTYVCHACDYVEDRDVNAAKNLVALAT